MPRDERVVLTRRTIRGYTFTAPVVMRTTHKGPGWLPTSDGQHILDRLQIPESSIFRPRHPPPTRPYDLSREAWYRPKVQRILDAVYPRAMHVDDLCEAMSPTHSRACHPYTWVAIFRAALSLVKAGGYEVVIEDEWHAWSPSNYRGDGVNPGRQVAVRGERTKFRKINLPGKGGRPPMVPPGSPPLARARVRLERLERMK